jgi:hypothetical protein
MPETKYSTSTSSYYCTGRTIFQCRFSPLNGRTVQYSTVYYCSNQRWFCIRASAVHLEIARIISHIIGLVGRASRTGVPYSFVREDGHSQDDSRARPIPRNMEILSLPNGPNKNESAYVSCSLPSTNPWYRASKTTSDHHACPHIQDGEPESC